MTQTTFEQAAGRALLGPQTVRYGDDPSQFVEIWASAAPGQRVPVVVLVHGGAWLQEFGIEFARPLVPELLAAGVAVAAVEYRRVGPDGTGGWPETAQDVDAALAALTTAPAPLGDRLDLGRVVLVGHSAGAQLCALAVAQAPEAVVVRGLVLQSGVLDLVDGAEQDIAEGAVPFFLDGTPDQRADVYAAASPVAHLPLGLPVVCVHGDADPVVPHRQSERFTAAARSAGDLVTLHLLPGVDHFDPITPGHPAWEQTYQAALTLVHTPDRS